jgi:hypothetical protein
MLAVLRGINALTACVDDLVKQTSHLRQQNDSIMAHLGICHTVGHLHACALDNMQVPGAVATTWCAVFMLTVCLAADALHVAWSAVPPRTQVSYIMDKGLR